MSMGSDVTVPSHRQDAAQRVEGLVQEPQPLLIRRPSHCALLVPWASIPTSPEWREGEELSPCTFCVAAGGEMPEGRGPEGLLKECHVRGPLSSQPSGAPGWGPFC